MKFVQVCMGVIILKCGILSRMVTGLAPTVTAGKGVCCPHKPAHTLVFPDTYRGPYYWIVTSNTYDKCMNKTNLLVSFDQ